MFETFGPVKKPYYSIRMQEGNERDIDNIKDEELFIIPENMEFTKYAFPDNLMR